MSPIMKWLWPFGYRNENQGPPDLEEAFKKMWSGLKGKKSQNGQGAGENKGQQSPDGQGPQKPASDKNATSGAGKGFGLIVGIVVAIVIVIWAIAGFFTVQPAEQGVVLRFGQYVRTVNPGLHWIPRFIESKYVVNVDQVNAIDLSQDMLTQGENFVKVSFAVQYKVDNLKDFLFNVNDPISSLQQIVDSAVRQVVGTSTLDNILTVGRGKITTDVQAQIEKLVKRYKNGVDIVSVQMQPAQPPKAVQAAFDDVIKAREDNQRLQSEAEGYANKIVPVAKGQANAMLKAAHADAAQSVLLAKGQVAMFDAILPKYKAAPSVTANRLYFETMEKALAHSHLVLLPEHQGNLTVLPLNQLLGGVGKASSMKTVAVSHDSDDSSSASAAHNDASSSNHNAEQTLNTQWARLQEAQQ